MGRAARGPGDWRKAAGNLARAHPTAGMLHERHGAPTGWRPVPPRERFGALARVVAYQQLSGRAASTIWGRVTAGRGDIGPSDVLDMGHGGLRGAGLSNAKASSLLDLADRVNEGSVDLAACARSDDEAVIEHLTQVRGIGPWSAQMFLIGVLGRTDVWPTGDVGVRNGWMIATGRQEPPDPAELGEVGEGFRPYRSVLAWWCWQEADTRLPQEA